MFVLSQGSGQHGPSSPEPFWIGPLERFMTGASCAAKDPRPTECPRTTVGSREGPNAWHQGGYVSDWDCCTSGANRGGGYSCNATCARAECAATPGMHWRALNNSVFPYTCCWKNHTADTALMKKTDDTPVGCPPGADANATATCLQAAFDAALPGDVIEIPFTGEPWVVSRPLFLRRDGITLQLLPGVVLEAQRGQFHGESDSLLTVGGGTAALVAGVTVRGSPGAVLRMHRADYANSTLYSKAEWRHGLQLVSVRDTLVESLRIELSGGDGVYVDQAKNTTIRNVDMADNYRQGISVVAADGLVVEDCLMHGTNGTNPQAGLGKC